MKILVVEDDKKQALFLKKELNSLGYDVIGPVANSTLAMKFFIEKQPDLALLCIKLLNSPMDGIEIAKAFNNIKNIPLVFLSKHCDEETKNRVKDIHPDNYLIKPVTPVQLDVALDFAQYRFMNKKGNKTIEKGSLFHPFSLDPHYFFIRQNGRYLRIRPWDICYLKAAGSQTDIYLQNNRYVVSTNLSDLLKQIHLDTLFQCHRSYAVNLTAVLGFDHNCLLVNHNGQNMEISIGETYRKSIFNKIKIIKSK